MTTIGENLTPKKHCRTIIESFQESFHKKRKVSNSRSDTLLAFKNRFWEIITTYPKTSLQFRRDIFRWIDGYLFIVSSNHYTCPRENWMQQTCVRNSDLKVVGAIWKLLVQSIIEPTWILCFATNWVLILAELDVELFGWVGLVFRQFYCAWSIEERINSALKENTRKPRI